LDIDNIARTILLLKYAVFVVQSTDVQWTAKIKTILNNLMEELRREYGIETTIGLDWVPLESILDEENMWWNIELRHTHRYYGLCRADLHYIQMLNLNLDRMILPYFVQSNKHDYVEQENEDKKNMEPEKKLEDEEIKEEQSGLSYTKEALEEGGFDWNIQDNRYVEHEDQIEFNYSTIHGLHFLPELETQFKEVLVDGEAEYWN